MNNISINRGIAIISEALKSMPNAPGIYKMIDAKGEVLYVGKAKSLQKRVASYTSLSRLVTRLQRMVSEVSQVDIVTTKSEAEALLLESSVVKKLQPKFNVLLKDDKSFPYLFINTEHEFPRILKYRGMRNHKGEYFGPFASAGIVNNTISLIQKAFLLRPCSDNIFTNRSRPCLQFQIKRCTAPCVGKVSADDYKLQVKDAVEFLSGKNREIQDALTERMLAASAAMDFELAAKFRDRIKALTQLQGQQKVHLNVKDADIITLFRHGEKSCIQVFFFRAGLNFGNQPFFPSHAADCSDAEILEAFIGRFYQSSAIPEEIILPDFMEAESTVIGDALSITAKAKIRITIPKRGDKLDALNQAGKNAKEALNRRMLENSSTNAALENLVEIFGLDAAPRRIEVYDNSHIMGSNQVGAMIVATPEGFSKKHYRKFNIQLSDNGDDYAMLAEVLTRRFTKLQDEETENNENWPDLVLIDGGLGQMGVAAKVFADLGLNIPFVGIAKGPDRNAGNETFFMPDREPFKLERNSSALFYLQRLRDEAHRFAIGSHRKKRQKGLSESRLDDIPGIGKKRRITIIQHFGSARAVESASVDEMAAIPGISRKVAEAIYSYFHS